MSEKVAIVTGAGSGIGRAIALALAQRGVAVVLVGRHNATLEETAQLIAALGGQCVSHTADVGDARMAAAVVAATQECFSRLDIVVNNAAQAVVAGIESLDLGAFDAMLRTNAAGAVYTCKAAWPLLKRTGGGTIVNVSSMAAVDPFPGLTTYGATKAFVNVLTKGLAAEGKKHNIRVFAVGPGAVETEMLRRGFPEFPAEQALPPAAIADLVVTLTEPACQYCTGQTIYVRK